MTGREMTRYERGQQTNWLGWLPVLLVGLFVLKEFIEAIPAMRRYWNVERM